MHNDKSHKTDVIRARIDPVLKAHAEAVFHRLGLTTSQAITLFLKQVELRHGMPFPINIPNSETAKVLKDAEAGIDVIQAKDIDDLFKKIDLDDEH